MTQLRWKRGVAAFRSAVPTSWVPDPDGRLDVSKVRKIMIGWGGYEGRRERVQFNVDDVAA